MEGHDESFYNGIRHLAPPATSPIRPLNLEPWPCALWVVKSQFALHNSSKFQWSMFDTGRPPLYCSAAHTHTHSGTQRANSAALFTPCLPPRPPLALFMKACPLSAALSAPSCYGADYPHPESTSFALFFFLFFIPLHSHSSGNSHPSLLCSILLLPLAPPWHIALLFLHGEHAMLTPQSSLQPPAPPSLWMKLCMSDKNNKINQASALPFIFTIFTLSSVPLASVSLILWFFHVLPLFIWLPPEVISRVYGREVGEERDFHVP